jgi:hypothetical protein
MMMHRESFIIDVPQWHYEPTADGHGRKTIHDPPTQQRVWVEIDTEAIAKVYGPRACKNNRRQSRQLHGLVALKCN